MEDEGATASEKGDANDLNSHLINPACLFPRIGVSGLTEQPAFAAYIHHLCT